MGHRFTRLSNAKRLMWHEYFYCLTAGWISCFLLSGDMHKIFYERVWDTNFHWNSQPSSGFRRAVGFSTGFLAFDLFMLLCFWRKFVAGMKWRMYMQMIVHHIMSIYAWPGSICGNKAYGFIAYCILTEGTSFFVNFRWLLREAQLDNTKLYAVNGVFVLVTFLIIRILPIPWVAWCFVTAPKSTWTWAETIFAAIVVPMPPLLNVYWFSFIVKGVISFFSPHRNGAAEKED